MIKYKKIDDDIKPTLYLLCITGCLLIIMIFIGLYNHYLTQQFIFNTLTFAAIAGLPTGFIFGLISLKSRIGDIK